MFAYIRFDGVVLCWYDDDDDDEIIWATSCINMMSENKLLYTLLYIYSEVFN